MPVMQRFKDALENYEKALDTAAENECNYIHTLLGTTISMIQKDRLGLISAIKNEMIEMLETGKCVAVCNLLDNCAFL